MVRGKPNLDPAGQHAPDVGHRFHAVLNPKERLDRVPGYGEIDRRAEVVIAIPTDTRVVGRNEGQRLLEPTEGAMEHMLPIELRERLLLEAVDAFRRRRCGVARSVTGYIVDSARPLPDKLSGWGPARSCYAP